MRTQLAIAMLMVVLAVPAQASLEDTAASLNTAIQEVTLKKVLPKLAETLQLEESVLDKALVQTKLKLSDIGLAKCISEKSGKPVSDYLTTENAVNWPELLKKNGIKESDAAEYLDNLQSEVAFAMLDFKAEKGSKVVGK